MNRSSSSRAGALALLVATLAACSDSGPVTDPSGSTNAVAAARAASPERVINIMDACDPATFDAAVGPGTCVRQGGVTFADFLAQIGDRGFAGAWHYAPPVIEAPVGAALLAVNHGGEVHTFTEVEHFGGGIIPLLNQLSGNNEPAPECLALAPADFIAPGGTGHDEVEEPGTELYQCCIHPWMRTVVHGRGG
jgi:hypothetical protein